MLPLDLTSDVDDEDDTASSVLSQSSHYTNPSFSRTVHDNESGTIQSLLKKASIVTNSQTPDLRLDTIRQCLNEYYQTDSNPMHQSRNDRRHLAHSGPSNFNISSLSRVNPSIL